MVPECPNFVRQSLFKACPRSRFLKCSTMEQNSVSILHIWVHFENIRAHGSSEWSFLDWIWSIEELISDAVKVKTKPRGPENCQQRWAWQPPLLWKTRAGPQNKLSNVRKNMTRNQEASLMELQRSWVQDWSSVSSGPTLVFISSPSEFVTLEPPCCAVCQQAFWCCHQVVLWDCPSCGQVSSSQPSLCLRRTSWCSCVCGLYLKKLCKRKSPTAPPAKWPPLFHHSSTTLIISCRTVLSDHPPPPFSISLWRSSSSAISSNRVHPYWSSRQPPATHKSFPSFLPTSIHISKVLSMAPLHIYQPLS